MKIIDVRTAILRGQRDWILVRVYTDEGIVGLGECFFGVGVPEIIQWDRPLVAKGYLRLPEGPGLGVELNEDLVRAHLKPNTGFFEPVRD